MVFAMLAALPLSAQSTITLWTNQTFHGEIRIYYNNAYVGSITKAYSSAPSCGAPGCVTITVKGTNNTFYGVGDDGAKWYSDKRSLSNGCTRIRLYSSHRVSSKSSSGHSVKSSSSNHNIYDDYMKESAEELGQALGTTIAYGLGAISDTDWDLFCNRIDIGVGYGISYGEMGVKLNYKAPAAFGASIAVGYDIANRQDYKNDVYWNAALQMWPTNGLNMELNLGPRYYKESGIKEMGIGFMLNYEHQIFEFIGITGGIGYSLAANTTKRNMRGRFEWNIGLLFRVFSD